jgi:tetratricopeptide (TPR) repeat protein
MESTEWSPVFYDAVSIVFVREKEENRAIIDKYLISKDKDDDKSLYKMLIVTFTNIAMDNQWNPNFTVDLGEIFYNMGNYKDALKAYEYADKRLAGQANVKDRIAMTRDLLDAQKSKEQKKKNHE